MGAPWSLHTLWNRSHAYGIFDIDTMISLRLGQHPERHRRVRRG